MILKSLFVGAALITTPLCLVSDEASAPQDPVRVDSVKPSAKPARPQIESTRDSLRAADRKLQEAEAKLKDTERQLEEVLDRLDATIRGPQARGHRDCAPARNRGLLTHFQWLRQNHHDARADTALDDIVKQVGDNKKRINGLAWDLMTNPESSGSFDEVALALAQRLERGGESNHRYLDTVALARFLNGQFGRAVKTQKKAIAHGGRSDDYRRRLRTYEAAHVALQAAEANQTGPGIAAVAGVSSDINAPNDDED